MSNEPAITRLAVEGMTCANCVRHATEALQSVSGVASVSVALDPGSAEVFWKSGATPNPKFLIKALTSAGFTGSESTATPHGKEAKTSFWQGWRLNVVVGSSCTLPLMLGEWLFHWGMQAAFHWISFLLALVVQVVCGLRFYKGAWSQLKQGNSNMDTLVSLGSTTAFGYSTYALLSGAPGHLYFMESASIITLISVGHWMEQRVSERAVGALRNLLDLTPEKAFLLDMMGREKEVMVKSLRIGDRVLLKPGAKVPTDGIVVSGSSAVDESMLTGESMPVEKSSGALVYGGTFNSNGRLVVRVTATGNSTALAQIIQAVRRAQTSRASIQTLADKISNVFVPIVVAIAVLTALWWGLNLKGASQLATQLSQSLWPVVIPGNALAAAAIHAAAVLIVACPCAMGLATPAAIMAGANAAAKMGILIRDGEALEKSGNITSVVFDKTGTLTQGKPAVQEKCIFTFPTLQLAEQEILNLAIALAAPSTHPISKSIHTVLPFADQSKLALTHWQEIRGKGVQAEYAAAKADKSSLCHLGSLDWLLALGVDMSPAASFQSTWSLKGATLVGLAYGSTLLAIFAIADSLKPNARKVVEQLRASGRQVYLLTGDHQTTANVIAGNCGIDSANVLAQVLPEQKSQWLEKLQARGEKVAFVGDGINDAPALEQADLGIAVTRASDVAKESADILLLRSDIESIPQALDLARATLRTIKQNLFWAFFYNAAAIPLAALGLMSPILCAAAMGFSDVIVIGNSLRLLTRKPD